jgi:hypothetical protein
MKLCHNVSSQSSLPGNESLFSERSNRRYHTGNVVILSPNGPLISTREGSQTTYMVLLRTSTQSDSLASGGAVTPYLHA